MPSIRTRYLNEGLANTGLNHARRCVICLAGRTGQARPALGLGELCRLHRHRRRDHGHPQIHNGLTAREWRPIVPAVLLYVKASPPSAEVLASVGRLLAPGVPPAPTVSARHPQRLLYAELVRWQQPQYRKVHRRWSYTNRGVLCRLLAAKVVVEEQERRFPGESTEVELVRVLCLMHRRPKQASGKHGTRMAGGARKLLAQRLRASALMVYLLTASRALIHLREQEQEAISKRPRKPQPPPDSIYTPTAPPRTAGGWPVGSPRMAPAAQPTSTSPPSIVSPPPRRDQVASLREKYGITVSMNGDRT